MGNSLLRISAHTVLFIPRDSKIPIDYKRSRMYQYTIRFNTFIQEFTKIDLPDTDLIDGEIKPVILGRKTFNEGCFIKGWVNTKSACIHLVQSRINIDTVNRIGIKFVRRCPG